MCENEVLRSLQIEKLFKLVQIIFVEKFGQIAQVHHFKKIKCFGNNLNHTLISYTLVRMKDQGHYTFNHMEVK